MILLSMLLVFLGLAVGGAGLALVLEAVDERGRRAGYVAMTAAAFLFLFAFLVWA